PLQSAPRPGLDREEVGSDDQIPVLLEELLPSSLPFPLWRWLDPLPCQDVGNRPTADFVSEIAERTLDPPISPGAIVPRHAHDQRLDLICIPLLASIVLLRNQTPMPGQQRLRRNDRTQLFKHLPSDPLGLGGQTAAVVVGETQPLPTQLLPQNTILLPKVIDE